MKNLETFEVEGQTYFIKRDEVEFLQSWMKQREIELRHHIYNFRKDNGITKENEGETNTPSKSK